MKKNTNFNMIFLCFLLTKINNEQLKIDKITSKILDELSVKNPVKIPIANVIIIQYLMFGFSKKI